MLHASMLLTYLLFAIVFLIFSYRHSSRLPIFIAVAWFIEAFRSGIEWILLQGAPVPQPLQILVDGSFILAVGVVAFGTLEYLGTRLRKLYMCVLAGTAFLLFVVARTSFGQQMIERLYSIPVEDSAQLDFLSTWLLKVPAAVILATLGFSLVRAWSGGRILEGTVILGTLFAVDALRTLLLVLGPVVSGEVAENLYVEFGKALCYSLGFLLLIIDREWEIRDEAEAAMRQSQKTVLNLTRNFPGMAYRCKVDARRTMTLLSPGVQTFLGYLPAEIVDNQLISYFNVIDLQDREDVLSQIREYAKNAPMVDLVYRVQTSGGMMKWAREQGQFVHGEDGRVAFLEGFISDVTRLQEVEVELEEANQELLGTVTQLEQRAKEIDLLNRIGEGLLQSNNEEDVGATLEKFLPDLNGQFSGVFLVTNLAKRVIKVCSTWNGFKMDENSINFGQCSFLQPRKGMYSDGRGETKCDACNMSRDSLPASICVPVENRTEIQGILHLKPIDGAKIDERQLQSTRQLLTTVAESTSLALANLGLRSKLQEQAIRDPLTQLFNRRHFEDSLDREISRAVRRQTTLCLAVLDLDYFKRVNDEHGHAAGDQVLRKVASHIRQKTRSEDILCRYGGEEFVILFPDIMLAECLKRAEEIRRGVGRLRIEFGPKRLSVTVSMGVASYPDLGRDRKSLFEAADKAVYMAKESGRNRVVSAQNLHG